MLDTTLSAFRDFEHIILVINQDDAERYATYDFPTVCGGNTRSESVMNALEKVTTPYVLIHDGARPYVSAEIIEGSVQKREKQARECAR